MNDKINLKISGVTLPPISRSGFNEVIYDVDGKGAGRNAAAFTRRNIVRYNMNRIDVKYVNITDAEKDLILGALNTKEHGATLNVEYNSPFLGNKVHRMDRGDITITPYGNTINGVFRWASLSFSLVIN